MANDDSLIRLQAQVQALELVTKTILSLHLSSQVKDEAGFAKAAEQAVSVRDALLDHLKAVDQQMMSAGPADIAQMIITEMRGTVGRCFDAPASQMRQIAAAVLAVSQPPTDARN